MILNFHVKMEIFTLWLLDENSKLILEVMEFSDFEVPERFTICLGN